MLHFFELLYLNNVNVCQSVYFHIPLKGIMSWLRTCIPNLRYKEVGVNWLSFQVLFRPQAHGSSGYP